MVIYMGFPNPRGSNNKPDKEADERNPALRQLCPDGMFGGPSRFGIHVGQYQCCTFRRCQKNAIGKDHAMTYYIHSGLGRDTPLHIAYGSTLEIATVLFSDSKGPASVSAAASVEKMDS